jgi:formylglycine-generating enzyme required for sulfatase activity
MRSGPKGTKPVGSYPPNAWGFFDMHGNVAEWCVDIPKVSPFPGVRPTDLRVHKDGSYLFLRGAAEFACSTPNAKAADLGFRVICVVK